MAEVQEEVTLASCVPQRHNRPTKQRKTLSLHPTEYERLRELASDLNVSLPDAVITMLNYLDKTEALIDAG